jgi:hypothetical protein
MTEAFFNRVVRLVIATTREELEAVLGFLPHGVRFGVAHQLDETGEAFRYEIARHCAYYLCQENRGIQVWRWSYIASEREFFRLRMLVMSLQARLDSALADSVFEHATRRTVVRPRPVGLAHDAIAFGDYPTLPANRALATQKSAT